jgi:hypothetical protein
MLTEILSSDKILPKGGENSGKSLTTIGEESAQFSKILNSLDSSAVSKSQTGGEIFENLQAIFEDDKEFLKESVSFLKGREREPKLLDNELLNSSENGEVVTSQKESNPLLGLNFGNYRPLQTDNGEEQKFKVIINEAKDFLKSELMKHSISEKDMPKSLRGLVELASTKGISLKDIKFTLDEKGEIQRDASQTTSKDTKTLKNSELGDSSKSARLIINQHSTEALLRSKSEALVLRARKTDQTPENLTKVKSSDNSEQPQKISTSQIDSSKEVKSLNLQSLLSSETSKLLNREQKTTSAQQPTLSSQVASEVDSESVGEVKGGEKVSKSSDISLSTSKNLGDILKVQNELQTDDNSKKVDLKSTPLADRISKFTGVSTEIVSTLFSDEELKDLGIEGKLSKSEVAVESTPEEHSVGNLERVKNGLELKIGEAKTMTRHLASNLQEQIENYKHPFQKLSLTLNPQKLGEVEVDIIKRGNSVKITLSGSTNTINLLSANSLELRNQLVNVGLQDPTFKFNEDGRNGSQQQQREQHVVEEIDEEKQESFEINVLEYV